MRTASARPASTAAPGPRSSFKGVAVETPGEGGPPAEGEDFYREGGYVVFTARYHLRRGYCCHSGCRHCPYGRGPESLEEGRESIGG